MNIARALFAGATVAFALGLAGVAYPDAADDAFARGQKAAKAGQLDEAEREFEVAWAQRKSWDFAGNLGLTEAALKKWDEAATHLDYALRHIGGLAKAEQRKALEDRLAESKKHVAAVTVKAPARSVILVDSKEVGVAPLDAPIYLLPGKHTIEARRDAHTPDSRSIEVSAGAASDIALEPTPGAVASASVSASVAPTSTSTAPPPDGRSPVPAIVLGGVGAAAIGAGIGLIVASVGKYRDAEEIAAGCPVPDAACAARGDEAIESSNLLLGIGIGAFALAGASLIGMTVYLLLPSEEPEAVSWQIAPWAGPGVGGVRVDGTF